VARPRLPGSRRKVNRLRRLFEGRHEALVLTHDNPDPDSLAAALALESLLASFGAVRVRIAYGGIIGRAENRNMVRLLRIPAQKVEAAPPRKTDAVILVDTQPGFANNSLPEGLAPLAVIDHHEGAGHADVPFVDVRREYGAVSTILTEYVVSAGLRPSPALATALCYAISTETQDLGREACQADVAAMIAMFPLADQPLLGRLRHPRRSIALFAELNRAILAARLAEDVVLCHMGAMPSPDLAAEMADVFIATEGINWVLCTGVYEESLIISVRTWHRDARAGELLRRVVGQKSRAGGHSMIAGGSLAVGREDDPAVLHRELVRRFLGAIGRHGKVRLVPLIAEAAEQEAEELEASEQ